MLTYATRSALLLRPLIQSTRATARALSATPYLDRPQQGPVWPTLTKKPDEKTLEKDGKGVCAWLGSACSKPADLNPQLAARVYDLYLPVYYWCKDVVEKNPTKPNKRPTSWSSTRPQKHPEGVGFGFFRVIP